MNKHFLILGMVVLLICVGLSGCNESNNSSKFDEDRIIGTWVLSDIFEHEGRTGTITFIFSSDKTYEVIGTFENYTESYSESLFNGTWKISDYKLIYTIWGETQTRNYKFSDNDKTLTLTDTTSNTTTIFIKKEGEFCLVNDYLLVG